MVRPVRCRRVTGSPGATYYKPRGVPLCELAEAALPLDGFEALRLADLEGLYHEEAARRMGVSRATFGNILEAARRAVADALVHGKALRIEGGAVTMDGEMRKFECGGCGHGWEVTHGTGRPESCPACGGAVFHRADRGAGVGAGAGGGGRHRRGRGCGRRGGR